MRWLLVLLVACAPDRGPAYKPTGRTIPRDGGTLTFATKNDIRTLDPSIGYDDQTTLPIHLLFDTLVDYMPGTSPTPLVLAPRLAQGWDVSRDGRRYVFHLRDGITYSDGTPVVARDFKFSLERALRSADSPFGSFLADVDGAQAVLDHHATDCTGITAPSDRELDIQLAHANAAFLQVLAMSFATPQRADHVAGAGDQLRREPLGTGPYVLERWDEGRGMVLARNPHYWDAQRAHIAEIEILENLPSDTQFLMFERGELDAVERLASPDYLWLVDQPDWRPYIHRRAPMNTYGARMNVRVKPFDDRRVRQALNYAVNKDHLVKLLNGAAIPAHGILPPGIAGRDDALAPYPHDPAKARALLAEAGYPHGFDTEYVVIADEEAEKLAGSLQADLAEVGVRVHLSVMAYATFATAIGSAHGPAFCQAGMYGDYPDASSFMDSQFHSRAIADESSSNFSFYANPELDALLDAARGETDPDKRAAMYRRAEQILHDDAPWLWMYHQPSVEVTQPYVRGYEPHPIWLRDFSSAWLDERVRR